MNLRNQFRKLAMTFGVATLIGASMFAGSNAAHANTIVVEVQDFQFFPQHVSISPGDTIRWEWTGNVAHSSTSCAGVGETWDSGVVGNGSVFEHTFNDAGVFTYFCQPHGSDLGNGNFSGMGGSIVVDDECLTLTLDQLVAGEVTTFKVTGGEQGKRVALVYGTSRGRTAVNGFANYCAVFGMKGVNQNRLIGTKILNPDATITQFIPGGVQGLNVSFQASMQDTCPDICMSNIIDATVQ